VSSLQHFYVFVLGHVSAHGMPNDLLVMSSALRTRCGDGAAWELGLVKVIYERGPQMTVPPRRRRLSAQRRHAIRLLASSQSGIVETLLFAHGVTPRPLRSE
jgi:hypothetical protein